MALLMSDTGIQNRVEEACGFLATHTLLRVSDIWIVMIDIASTAFVAVVSVASTAVFVAFIRNRRFRALLPPGPPAEPLIGHLRYMPNENERDEVFHRWSIQYGDNIIFS